MVGIGEKTGNVEWKAMDLGWRMAGKRYEEEGSVGEYVEISSTLHGIPCLIIPMISNASRIFQFKHVSLPNRALEKRKMHSWTGSLGGPSAVELNLRQGEWSCGPSSR